jgi:antitoxin CptB
MNKPLTEHELRLKRLKFRSGHRGWKEMDLILGHFAEAQLNLLTTEQLAAYESLLEQDDDVIWRWLTGKEETPDAFAEITQMLEGYGKTA